MSPSRVKFTFCPSLFDSSIERNHGQIKQTVNSLKDAIFEQEVSEEEIFVDDSETIEDLYKKYNISMEMVQGDRNESASVLPNDG